MKNQTENCKINLSDRNMHIYFVLMKTKNGHILTFSDKLQISALLCCATCDWFCQMTSHIIVLTGHN